MYDIVLRKKYCKKEEKFTIPSVNNNPGIPDYNYNKKDDSYTMNGVKYFRKDLMKFRCSIKDSV